MKIKFLYSGNYPDFSPGSKRIGYYKKAIEEYDSEIQVEIEPLFLKLNSKFDVIKKAIFVPFFNFFSFLLKKDNSDSYFLYGFEWLSILLFCLAAKIKGKKIYMEVNEKPCSFYGNFVTEKYLIKKLNTFLTNYSFRFLDGFIVISKNLESLIKIYAKKEAIILKIPILVEVKKEDSSIEKPLAQFPYFLHAGALSDRKDGIINVFKAFALVCKETNYNLHFYLTSKVAIKTEMDQINEIIEVNNLKNNVHFLGMISDSELLKYQKFCSFVILNKYTNEQNLFNFPTKLGEFMALKIPVITTAVGEMKEYLEDENNALIFQENNNRDLANKIYFILNNKEFANKIGENCYETAFNNFNYKLFGNKLYLFFKNNLN